MLEKWRECVVDVLENLANTGNLGAGDAGSGNADNNDFEYAFAYEEDSVPGKEGQAHSRNRC